MSTIGAQQATIHHMEWPVGAADESAPLAGAAPAGPGLDGVALWSCTASTSTCVGSRQEGSCLPGLRVAGRDAVARLRKPGSRGSVAMS